MYGGCAEDDVTALLISTILKNLNGEVTVSKIYFFNSDM